MNIKYISDKTGKITSVIIPIHEWLKLKKKFDNLDKFSVPEWQKELVNERLIEYNSSDELPLNFDDVIKDIENDL